MSYIAATQLSQALDVLALGPAEVIAGGTDWFPAMGERVFDGTLLDVTRILDLNGVTETSQGWRIGATTTWSDIIRADLPPAFDGLKQAAREVGSVQIQNTGTIAGNLCNASPAADGVPPLLTLEAEVELTSAHGQRRMALGDFLKGVRQTERQPNELLTAIYVPKQPSGARSAFFKLGSRRYLVISITMVSVVVALEEGRIVAAKIAIGAASAVAQRMIVLEGKLVGLTPDELAGAITAEDFDALSPITDIRGSDQYRQEAVVTATHRAMILAVKGAA
jgi:CO/xanthine dehydrogenase FAD-binding subunit